MVGGGSSLPKNSTRRTAKTKLVASAGFTGCCCCLGCSFSLFMRPCRSENKNTFSEFLVKRKSGFCESSTESVVVAPRSDVGSLDSNDDVFEVRENNGWSPLKRRKKAAARNSTKSNTEFGDFGVSGLPNQLVSHKTQGSCRLGKLCF